MEDRYIEILNKSSYHELTTDEKEVVMELCSNEEEFENVKHLYREMESLGTETFTIDSTSVKSLLDSEFKEVHASDRGFRILKFLFPPLVPVYSKPGIQLAFLLVCIVSIYLSFQKVTIEPTKKVRYAQNNDEDLKEDSNEDIEFKKEESSSELSTNLNAVPDVPPPTMEELAEIEEEVIMDMEAPHFDMAGRAREDVGATALSFEADMASGSGVIEDADFNGFVSDEGRFIIEPVGSHMELIEDLFVTF